MLPWWRGHCTMYFSHLGVFLVSVKPLTIENTENKSKPNMCKITAFILLFIEPTSIQYRSRRPYLKGVSFALGLIGTPKYVWHRADGACWPEAWSRDGNMFQSIVFLDISGEQT